MKTCSRCKKTKEKSLFGVHKKSKDGLKPLCKSCVSLYNVEYRNKNREFKAKLDAAYRVLNKEKHKEYLKTHYITNSATYKANAAKRRAAKIQRTPKWANFERIKAYYDVCSFFNEVNGYTKYHVDHTIPLQGENVSGLHVHNNLQILLAEENLAKSNKYE